MHFLSIRGQNFISHEKTVQLKGAGLGNWLNLEHFLFGWPGTDSQIRQAIQETYGEEKYTLFWDRYYSVYVQEADIRYVHQCGMNHVRIPVNYRLFFTDSFEKSIAIREIDRVLSYCKKYGIWGIIDLHAVPGGQNPDWHSDNHSGKDHFWHDRRAMDLVVKLWGRIAGYYRNNPVVGGYDLINEPCFFSKASETAMLSFFRKCTAAIRSKDTNHIIFYEGNTYSRDFSMFSENLDDHSSYTFHLYPFLQIPGELHSDHIHDKLIESLYRDVTYEHLIQKLKKPLWCGETGHPLHLSGSRHILEAFLLILEDKQIGWALWPLKDSGAMAITYAKKESAWNRLCRQLSEDWIFWSIFTQDSILSAEKEKDKYAYYKWLAKESTKAWEIVRNNLSKCPFDRLLEALEDFKFENCIKTEF
ncbi:cellulase family glycosylhydrolase [bacterium]|nr:cellulase family glycosylhydrolase [bacterium]